VVLLSGWVLIRRLKIHCQVRVMTLCRRGRWHRVFRMVLNVAGALITATLGLHLGSASATQLASENSTEVVLVEMLDPLTGKSTPLTPITEKNDHLFAPSGDLQNPWGWPSLYDDLGSEQVTVVLQWQKAFPMGNDGPVVPELAVAVSGRPLSADEYSVREAANWCYFGESCLAIELPRRSMFPSGSGGEQVVRTIEIDQREPEAATLAVISVVPSRHSLSYFSQQIAPTFLSDRCQVCHSFTTDHAIVVVHEELLGSDPDCNGPPLPALEDVVREESLTQSGKDVLACAFSCHAINHQLETLAESLPMVALDNLEWATPSQEMNIDWFEIGRGGVDPSAICTRVTSILPPAELDQHFRHDGRLVWAVSSAARACGGNDLPRSEPGSYEDWLSIISPWIEAGAPCDPSSPPVSTGDFALPDDCDLSSECLYNE